MVGKIYRNFKGSFYIVLMLATDTVTNGQVVVYQNMITKQSYTRPQSEFNDLKKLSDGKLVKRFTCISDRNESKIIGRCEECTAVIRSEDEIERSGVYECFACGQRSVKETMQA